jgi:hypothetical protein
MSDRRNVTARALVALVVPLATRSASTCQKVDIISPTRAAFDIERETDRRRRMTEEEGGRREKRKKKNLCLFCIWPSCRPRTQKPPTCTGHPGHPCTVLRLVSPPRTIAAPGPTDTARRTIPNPGSLASVSSSQSPLQSGTLETALSENGLDVQYLR